MTGALAGSGSAVLRVVCGLPGAGKTTLAKTLPGIRLSTDEWLEALGRNLWDQDMRGRITELQWSLMEDLLRAGVDVVVEWGTWARSERDELREWCRANGVGVELHVVDAPLEVLLERITARGREDPPITMAHLTEWSTWFERPGPDELALFDRG
jgi:predicted kinase